MFPRYRSVLSEQELTIWLIREFLLTLSAGMGDVLTRKITEPAIHSETPSESSRERTVSFDPPHVNTPEISKLLLSGLIYCKRVCCKIYTYIKNLKVSCCSIDFVKTIFSIITQFKLFLAYAIHNLNWLKMTTFVQMEINGWPL